MLWSLLHQFLDVQSQKSNQPFNEISALNGILYNGVQAINTQLSQFKL